MDYLYQRNRWVAASGGPSLPGPRAWERDHRRGQAGDRGRRWRHRYGLHLQLTPRGCAHVVMLDVYTALPPDGRDPRHPWPLPPKRTLSTYALEEGGKRRWGTEVTGFGGRDGRVSHVYARQVTGTSSRDLTPVPGSEFVLEADLVLIAIGFEGPRAGRHARGARPGDRQARQHPHRDDLPQLGARRVRMRRRPNRPVADRHRDRRGTQVRSGGQPGPRGQPDGRRPGDARHRAPGAARPTARCATRRKPRGRSEPARSSSAGLARGRGDGPRC